MHYRSEASSNYLSSLMQARIFPASFALLPCRIRHEIWPRKHLVMEVWAEPCSTDNDDQTFDPDTWIILKTGGGDFPRRWKSVHRDIATPSRPIIVSIRLFPPADLVWFVNNSWMLPRRIKTLNLYRHILAGSSPDHGISILHGSSIKNLTFWPNGWSHHLEILPYLWMHIPIQIQSCSQLGDGGHSSVGCHVYAALFGSVKSATTGKG